MKRERKVKVVIKFWKDKCSRINEKCQFLKEGHHSFQHGYSYGLCLIYLEFIKRDQTTGEYFRCSKCISHKEDK